MRVAVPRTGAVGAAAGFFGPIILDPGANQGPLLGLLITGPGGAIAGLVLGFLFGALPFTDILRLQALLLCCMLLAGGTLWYCLPGPRLVSRVVEGTIEYAGGGTCASYPRGKEVLLAPTGEGTGLPVLEPVPERYRRLIAAS